MKLFKNKYETELDVLIARIDMDCSNNYKDNAQADLRDFEKRFAEIREQGALKEKATAFYESKLAEYQSKLKGYTHKDQKTTW